MWYRIQILMLIKKFLNVIRNILEHCWSQALYVNVQNLDFKERELVHRPIF